MCPFVSRKCPQIINTPVCDLGPFQPCKIFLCEFPRHKKKFFFLFQQQQNLVDPYIPLKKISLFFQQKNFFFFQQQQKKGRPHEDDGGCPDGQFVGGPKCHHKCKDGKMFSPGEVYDPICLRGGDIFPPPPCIDACRAIDVPTVPGFAPFTLSCPFTPYPSSETCEVTSKDFRFECLPKKLQCGQVFTEVRCTPITCPANPHYGVNRTGKTCCMKYISFVSFLAHFLFIHRTCR